MTILLDWDKFMFAHPKSSLFLHIQKIERINILLTYQGNELLTLAHYICVANVIASTYIIDEK